MCRMWDNIVVDCSFMFTDNIHLFLGIFCYCQNDCNDLSLCKFCFSVSTHTLPSIRFVGPVSSQGFGGKAVCISALNLPNVEGFKMKGCRFYVVPQSCLNDILYEHASEFCVHLYYGPTNIQLAQTYSGRIELRFFFTTYPQVASGLHIPYRNLNSPLQQ